MLSMDDIIQEIEATGLVKNTRPLSIENSCSGSTFFFAESAQDGEPLFLKKYSKVLSKTAQIEKTFTAQCVELFETKQCKHLATIPIYQLIPLSDETVVLVMKYVEGENLTELIEKKTVLSRERSEFLSAAFLELAHALTGAPFIHRDVCPKNLMVFDSKLFLFDFQTAIDYKDPVHRNPPLVFMRSNFGLGAGYNPTRGQWNDLFSLAKTYEELKPILDIDPECFRQNLSNLYELSKTVPTLQARYIVDDDWKKANKKAYYKILFRPFWTMKPSSQRKRAGLVKVLKQLYRTKSGEMVP